MGPLASSAPALLAPLPPRNRNYQRAAYFTIREGLTRAAAAHRRADDAGALQILTDGELARTSGIILETYPASTVSGAPGTLTTDRADALAKIAFDETYSVGKTGQRGIVVGQSNIAPGVFARPEDYRRWMTARVLAAMTAWIAVWQDVAGNRAVSTVTLEYVKERKDATGWASLDTYSTLADLDVAVPRELLADPRFPGWAPMAAWREAHGR